MKARKPLLVLVVLAMLTIGSYTGYKLKTGRRLSISGPALTVSFLGADLGGGILIKTPERKFMLIDPGPKRTANELIEHLLNEDAKSVTVVLTNPSYDGIGALEHVLDNTKVTKLYCGEQIAKLHTWKSLKLALGKKQIPEQALWAGKSIRISGRTVLEVLSPPAGLLKDVDEDSNSMVVRIRFGAKSFLLTSDIRTMTEAHLITSGLNLRSDVLAVPRHGRRPCMSLELLREVRPEICEISAGTGSDRPCRALLNRIATRNTGADVCRTDKYGTIDMVTDGRSIVIQTEKRGQ